MRQRAAGVVAAGAVVVLGFGALLIPGRSSSAAAEGQASVPSTATAAVERRTLKATTPVDGTLGYAHTYAIANAMATSGGADPASLAQAHTSAQAQYNTAVAALAELRHPKATDVANAQALLAAAQAALDAVLHANPAPRKADLASARAQVKAARTALSALRHPTKSQLDAAKDAVATARAQLTAAKAALHAPRGVLTQVANVGSIVQPGQTLYTLDGTEVVVLMKGVVPAWRELKPDVSDGPDVEQLEANLRDLGFGSSSLTVDQHWDDETTAAVKRWQHARGLAETGTIPLGQVVFEPGAMRITANTATLGSTVQAGTAILQASSTEAVVSVALSPALQTQIRDGDPVSVILPDGSTTPGKVSDVGTVATTPASDGAGGGDSAEPTITVLVTLDDPSASGGLDQAPVSVSITTATADDVLAVPVGALVQTLDGTYAVQVEEAGQLRYVPVELGLFAGGWVEVSGPGLADGSTVVVAR
jgi:multidrug efflux pump subunit AcrA (membrane-fusion protein)